jgi:hypothetical protein
VFAGSFTIQNQLDLDTISPYCEITGNLVIETGLTTITLPSLQKVDGTFTVDAQSLTSLSMPALLTLQGGGSTTSRTTGLTALSFPALETISALFTSNAPNVTTFDAPSLTAANLQIWSTLDNLDFGALSSGSLGIMRPAQNHVILPSFVSGTLDISSIGVVSAPNMLSGSVDAGAGGASPGQGAVLTALQTGTVTVHEGTVDLSSFSSGSLNLTVRSDTNLPLLTTASSLTLNVTGSASAPLLTSVTGAAAITATGMFSAPRLTSVTSGLSLYALSGLDAHSLTTAGWLDVEGTLLTTLSLPALTSLTAGFQAVDAALVLGAIGDFCESLPTQQNSQLTTLDLPLLTQLGPTNHAEIGVWDNPQLPQCRIDALVAQLKAAGWTGHARYELDCNLTDPCNNCFSSLCSACPRPTSPCP